MQSCTLNPRQMEDLLVALRQLPDCRKPQGLRHPYFSVLTISLAAILGGAKTYIAIAEWADRLTQNQLRKISWRISPSSMKTIFPPPSQTIDKGHGRLETRTLRATTLLNDYLQFPYCG